MNGKLSVVDTTCIMQSGFRMLANNIIIKCIKKMYKLLNDDKIPKSNFKYRTFQ